VKKQAIISWRISYRHFIVCEWERYFALLCASERTASLDCVQVGKSCWVREKEILCICTV